MTVSSMFYGRNLLRRLRRRAWRLLGVDTNPGAAEWRMEAAIGRAAVRCPVGGIIDVGASDGSWSRMARRYWPHAEFLLIEANDGHVPALEATRLPYVLAAAGSAVGEIHFDAADLYGGVASYSVTGEDDRVVPMTTVDHEVDRVGLPEPHLLKLDTHGFEREILEGATKTLERASLLVIEAYNFELMPGSLRFPGLCAYLEERGFRCLDLADPMHRPKDSVFWQLDLLFARADDPRFSDATYG